MSNDRHFSRLEQLLQNITECQSKKEQLALLRDASRLLAEQKSAYSSMEKKVDQVLSSISHDIRNPLAAIKGYASLLLDEVSTNTTTKRLAEQLLKGIDHLDEVLRRIIHSSKEVKQ